MKKSNKTILAALLAGSMTFGVVNIAQAMLSDAQAALAKTLITASQALRTTQNKIGADAKVKEVKFHHTKYGKDYFEVNLFANNQHHKVDVDAVNGEILGTTSKTPKEVKIRSEQTTPKISFEQAMTDISKVWASVGVPVAMQGQKRWVQAGESYYAGDGGNKANTKSIHLVSSALDYNKNNKDRKLINSNQPIAGSVVARAYDATEFVRNSMINQAQTKNINHNNKIDVVVNGGVNVQSSASTITGTTTDAMIGLNQGLNIMSFNNGLN
ncbi:PepSY domain-containing protein [Rodentibacter sp. Ppn85]|uniref:PepSY domain-containing protein n=1 Tax=Rodentibacter sp. Ppn85 TaxID=1908525 RepID=UPI00098770A7|nr:PepSY domain-containing protein [Rodentibacter sp. Ppn85]OOF63844.1 hypothetical protein BKL51_08055 [Rodentibacter sp. Ppn85]